MSGLIVDSFAGGGGASTGIEMALGRSPDVAINHDAEALAMHAANHPATLHLTENVWQVDPLAVTKGRPVDLLWMSPDCRHHSKAKGGKPVSRSVRGLADVGLLWAQRVLPNVICLENVEEFEDWGPLTADGRPCPEGRGQDFARWVRALESLGYEVQKKRLRACDYGSPTIRRRLFVVARRDRLPIVWPAPTHAKDGAGGLKPWRTAAEIIDWSLPCPSIFLTRDEAKASGLKVVRPLAAKTLSRIARGVKRYILDRPDPFIVIANHGGEAFRGQGLDDPMRTVCKARDAWGLVAPVLTYAQHGGLSRPADEPHSTVTASRKDQNQVAAAFLAQHNTDMVGHDMREPVSTVVGKGCTQAPVLGFLSSYYGTDQAPEIAAPLPTATTKDRLAVIEAAALAPPLTEAMLIRARQVAAFLRAEGVWDGPGDLVMVGPCVLWDIGMRMLTARELARAQGFPDSYVLAAPLPGGGTLTDTAQRHKIGNSVCPQVAQAIVRANLIDAREMAPVGKRRRMKLPLAAPSGRDQMALMAAE
jgi:DNA (cytosine-5)-methyltransferase 1